MKPALSPRPSGFFRRPRCCFPVLSAIFLVLCPTSVGMAAAHRPSVDSGEAARGGARDNRSPRAQPISWSELSGQAEILAGGDGLQVIESPDGAILQSVFQRLQGEATRQGLWLTSTVEGSSPERFRVVASRVGRSGASGLQLAAAGEVRVQGGLARFLREGLIEEYSTNVDGVRQDFLVLERPEGEEQLQLDLALAGARVEAAPYGVRLVLNGSGRKIAYSRLRVVDAEERELPARMTSLAPDRLAVLVDDSEAVYPVRVDPTFSDENWVSMGGLTLGESWIYTSAIDVSGNLYIGGSFTAAGGIEAGGVAKWDGAEWTCLDGGVAGGNAEVFGLAVAGENLYVAGNFSSAGGVAANNVAKWDGSGWSALGIGVDGTARAIAVSGTNVYVGGNFTSAGGLAANKVAGWNGSDWFSLGSGVTGGSATVHALATWGSVLYVGGEFSSAGGVAAENVARWNGSSWSALGSGLSSSWVGVRALAVSGSTLYAGGGFGLRRWNGSSWFSMNIPTDNMILTLSVSPQEEFPSTGSQNGTEKTGPRSAAE